MGVMNFALFSFALGLLTPALSKAPASVLPVAAVRLSSAFDRDYTEKINGTTLHFRVRGTDEKNPILLILHGGPGFSATMFYPWGKSLEEKLTVVYLDQRGSGGSERLKPIPVLNAQPEDGQGYTISKLLDDLEGVRTFLKVEKWFVLGHSWGGMLGVEYVTKYPQNVRGYIHLEGLISQPLAQETILASAEKFIEADEKSGDPARIERGKRIKPYLAPAKALPPGSERLMRSFGLAYGYFGEMYYADAKVGLAYNAKIKEASNAYGLKASQTAMAQEPSVALELTEKYAERDVLAKLPLLAQIPTLILNGKQDGVISPAMAERVHREAKGSKLLILEHCGHFPFAEQPEKTTSAILEFVGAQKP